MMIVSSLGLQKKRLASDAGIAIGPILFIIAVLGILAAAIAAGSGSFTTGTASESNRAKASAIIDIGQNLKIGFDRIVGNGVDFADVNIDPEDTSNSLDLFSPAGGGIGAPSVTMAADPANDIWYYPLIAIPRIGGSGGSRVAVLRVAEGVCDDINAKAAAVATSYAANNPVDVNFATDPDTVISLATDEWPANLLGKPTGCVKTTDTTITAGFYFYQVLGIQ